MEGNMAKYARKPEKNTLQSLSVNHFKSSANTLVDNRSSNQSAAQRQPVQRNNTGLPDNLKSGMEDLSGMSLDHVKVHYNSPKPAAVQAHAYAQGSDIHLASGQEKHLPHELGHVVQQMQGRVKPTTSVEGVSVNDSPQLEAEATLMGNRALQRKPVNEGEANRASENHTLDNQSPVVMQGMFEWLYNLFSSGEDDSAIPDFEPEPFATSKIPVTTEKMSKPQQGYYSTKDKRIALSDDLDSDESRFILLEEQTHALHHQGGAKLDSDYAQDEDTAYESFEDSMMTEFIAKYKRMKLAEEFLKIDKPVPFQDKTMLGIWQKDPEQWAGIISNKYYRNYAPRYMGLGPYGGMPKTINQGAAMNIGRTFLKFMKYVPK